MPLRRGPSRRTAHRANGAAPQHGRTTAAGRWSWRSAQQRCTSRAVESVVSSTAQEPNTCKPLRFHTHDGSAAAGCTQAPRFIWLRSSLAWRLRPEEDSGRMQRPGASDVQRSSHVAGLRRLALPARRRVAAGASGKMGDTVLLCRCLRANSAPPARRRERRELRPPCRPVRAASGARPPAVAGVGACATSSSHGCLSSHALRRTAAGRTHGHSLRPTRLRSARQAVSG